MGAAFLTRERDAWSEELFKLGIQFAREGEIAGRLFERLGLLLTRKERFGEAIGVLRRALALGGSEEKLLVPLARAFLKTDKVVPAAALLHKARTSGYDTALLAQDLAEIRSRLGDAKTMWDGLFSDG